METNSVRKTHQAIAEEAFYLLEDESVDCKVYGHKQRAIAIILAAIGRARDEWLDADYVASNDPAAQPQVSDPKHFDEDGTFHEGKHPPATDDRVKEQEWWMPFGTSVKLREATLFHCSTRKDAEDACAAHNAAVKTLRDEIDRLNR